MTRVFAYPLSKDGAGQYRTVELGSGDEIGGCVQLIADCHQGQVRSMPDLGRPELAFRQGAVGQQEAVDALDGAIREQEPRAQGYDIVSDALGSVTVDVRGVADDAPTVVSS